MELSSCWSRSFMPSVPGIGCCWLAMASSLRCARSGKTCYGASSNASKRRLIRVRAGVTIAAHKGFGGAKQEQQEQQEHEQPEQTEGQPKQEQQQQSSSQGGPKVYSPPVELAQQAQSNSQSDSERIFLLAMGTYLGFLFLAGLVLAGSGLLPQQADALVETYLYPSYSYLIGAFVVLSGVYGFIKGFT